MVATYEIGWIFIGSSGTINTHGTPRHQNTCKFTIKYMF